MLRPMFPAFRRPACRLFHVSAARLLDPYASLGVKRDASDKEIKKKYYELAKKFHPDVNKDPGADKKFQDIQNSYEILSNSDKRRQFDQFGSTGDGPGGPGGAGAAGPQYSNYGFDPFAGNFGGFEDFFSSFGRGQTGGRQQSRPQTQIYQGEDIEIMAQLTLEQAATGATQSVRYSVINECNTCHGSGLKTGAHAQTCSSCHGSGTTLHVVQGGFQMASTCPECHGSGEVVPKSAQCTSCHGEGTKTEIKTYKAEFPAGVKDGMRLRERGLGDVPPIRKSSTVKTRPGDLLINIKIKPHSVFKRVQNDLVYNAHIPPTTAILGGKIQIPTLIGPKVSLNVPSGTKYNDVIVVPEQGMPFGRGGSSRGDMRVNIIVDSFRPKNETETVLLEALADAIGDSNARRKFKPLNEIELEEEKNTNSAEKPKESLFRRLLRKVLPRDN